MKRLSTLNPKYASEILFGLPMLIFFIFLIVSGLTHNPLLLTIPALIFLILGFYALWWRFHTAKLMYSLIPSHVPKPIQYYRFFKYSHLVYLILLAWLVYGFFVDGFPFLLITVCIAFIISMFLPYIQCNFISKVISIIYHQELLDRKKWPLHFVTIAHYPVTASKVHSITKEIYEKNNVNA